MRSPRLGAFGLLPADLLAAALGGRPRARLAAGALAFAAAADVDLLEGGALLTRVSTRSAVSRSVNRVATASRSVSTRAIRSLILVFSALIWSDIVGVVVGMVTFSGFRSIGMIDLGGVYHRNAGFSTAECADRLCWRSMRFAALLKISQAATKLVLLDMLASGNCRVIGGAAIWCCPGRHRTAGFFPLPGHSRTLIVRSLILPWQRQ